MGIETLAENSTQTEILLTLPNKLLKDSKKIASLNNSYLDDLVYSYVVDGIANDYRIAKREEFTDKANEAAGNKSIHSKTAEEILNDFNLYTAT